MKVRYIYSACIEIETHNKLRILCDPWFTEGIYDGSWYHYPEIKNPLKILREPDVIYISHIHPDHYDPDFLKELFRKFGKKKIIIPDIKKNYLFFKSKFDGIETDPTKHLKLKGVNIHLMPNTTGSESDIDSALIVNDGKSTVLNLNDCIWNESHSRSIKKIISKYSNDLKLVAVGYTGAGPFPQTYFDLNKDKKKLIREAKNKKNKFFKRYLKYTKFFNAKYNLPFAGKYLLGGKLANLNHYRGIADPLEISYFDKKAIILDDKGKGEIDLNTNKITRLRKKKYSTKMINKKIKLLKSKRLDYENDIKIKFENINFLRLMIKAGNNALKKSELSKDYYLIFKIMENKALKKTICIKVSKKNYKIKALKKNREVKEYKPRSEIFIDYRYLFGLLTGIYHWNNAEVGSQYFTRRLPNHHNIEVQHFLNFFSAV